MKINSFIDTPSPKFIPPSMLNEMREIIESGQDFEISDEFMPLSERINECFIQFNDEKVIL